MNKNIKSEEIFFKNVSINYKEKCFYKFISKNKGYGFGIIKSRNRGQILLEALIVIPVILLVTMGIIQFILLGTVRASVSYSAYSVAREIIKEPSLIDDTSMFNRARIELLRALTPVSPGVSTAFLDSIRGLADSTALLDGLENVNKIKTFINEIKEGKNNRVFELVDKAIYTMLFASFNVYPLNKKKQIDFSNNSNFIPVIYLLTVNYWYPLIPFIGKLYCTKFTFSKKSVMGKINNLIDEYVDSFNIYLTEKINEKFDILLDKTWGEVKESWENTMKYREIIIEKERNVDEYYNSVTTAVWKIDYRCGKYKSVIDTLYNDITVYNKDVKKNVKRLRNRCLTMRDNELKETVLNLKDAVNQINNDIYLINNNLNLLNDSVGNSCKVVRQYKDLKINFSQKDVNCSINLPCNRLKPNLNNYTIDQFPENDNRYIIPVIDKTYDKERRTINDIKHDTGKVKSFVGDKDNELIAACNREVREFKTNCTVVNNGLTAINGKVNTVNEKAEIVNNKIGSFCTSNKKTLKNVENELNNLYLPAVIDETSYKRAEFCNKLKTYGKQLSEKISDLKSKKIDKGYGKLEEYYVNCKDISDEVNKNLTVFHSQYMIFQNVADNIINNEMIINPKEYIKKSFNKQLDSYWDTIYKEEDKLKVKIKKKYENSIPDNIPFFSLPDPKKCNPMLYFAGIYAVPISSTELMVLNPASVVLKGENFGK